MSNANLTHIVFILDRSGSMQAMQEEAIQGYNRFLAAQKTLPGHTRFSLILFNERIETLAYHIPADQMVPLDAQTFAPCGRTALDDAIASTIHRVATDLQGLPEEQLPGKMIFAILTDGEENSSRNYSTENVESMIKHHRARGWDFRFLGASYNTVKQATERGIDKGGAIQFSLDQNGFRDAFSQLNQDITRFRH